MRYDIVSGPDIIGEEHHDDAHGDDGHHYDVGADLAKPGGYGKPKRPLATGPGGTRLQGATQHDHLRRQIAPLPITVLTAAGTAGATQNVPLQVQRVFRVERLMVNSSLNQLSQVVITQINVGQDPQFVNAGAVPVSAFFATSFGLTLRGNTAYPGLTITFSFQNLGPAQDTITGMIVGEAIPQ